MQTYEYRGFDRAGHTCRGLVEALSVKAAREQLAADGILVERVSVTGRGIRFPRELRATIYSELAELLRSGMEVVPALDVMIEAPELTSVRGLLAALRDRLKEGAGLAGALAQSSPSVSAFEQALVEAGQRTGSVADMLSGLAGYLEDQEQLRQRIQSALMYPMIVLCAGICVAIVMLGVLVPRAQTVMAGSASDVPALTRAMIGFGRWALHWGWAPVAAVLAAVAAIAVAARRNPALALRLSRGMFQVPVWRHGATLLVNMRFARTLSILLQGGVPLVEGVVMAGRATGSEWVAHVAREEAEAVRHGSSLSDAVRRIPPLAGTLPGWIRIGEASGGLERLLRTAGERYHAQWERFLSRLTSLLEPLLILLVGGFVLLITLAVLLPILSLTRSVAG